MGEGDHYRTLGLRRDASKADIKNAFFRLAHRYHPDHHPHADAAARAETALRFRQAKDAYEILSDDRRRAEYDFRLRSSSSSSSSSGYRHRHGQGGSTSSSSSASSGCGQRHGHGAGSRSRPPPPPRGGSKLYDAFLCALFVLSAIGTSAEEMENWERKREKREREREEKREREREKREREWEEVKREWEEVKREWEKINPWKSWMESKEKKKNEASKKNWWTGFFKS